jgi:hypothetical protein
VVEPLQEREREAALGLEGSPSVVEEEEEEGSVEVSGGPSAGTAEMLRIDGASDVAWVYNALGMADSGSPVDLGAAPSPGAAGLLRRCLQDAAMRDLFYKQIFTRMLPTRSETEARARLEDDGAEITGHTRRLLARCRSGSLGGEVEGFFEEDGDE